jgi:TfoX/Sxy family transcriptional regulator of competence genes
MNKSLEIFVFALNLDTIQYLMDKSLDNFVFALAWTQDSIWWTGRWRILSSHLLGHKTLFGGQVAGEFCLRTCLDTRQYLVDRLLENFVFALGHKSVFDGQVAGEFCLRTCLDTRQYLTDKSLDNFVFALAWTQDSV